MSDPKIDPQNAFTHQENLVAGPSAPAAVLAPPVDPANPTATDHIASLPSMSLTAGLGSGDYVAVSIAAVVALLLGVGSLLSFISSALLAIPIAGLVVSIIAFLNIRRSNGTLTGRGLAAIGLVLSIGIGTLTGGLLIKGLLDEHEASQEINQVAVEFGRHLKNHEYDAMYDMLSERFKGRVPHAAFVEKMSGIQDSLAAAGPKGVGEIIGIHGGGPLFLTQEPGTTVQTAITSLTLQFANPKVPTEDVEVDLRRSLDQWQIDSIPDLFPPPKDSSSQ
ncbi:MAG TPA: DUF4190 domain-containing protein [Tepidisphaeraceae bacterium]|nr:DUF4190 domain-containing protein [Tepidisphaeraceae bacterium]